MKWQQPVRLALLAFVSVGAAFTVFKSVRAAGSASEQAVRASAPRAAVVYYFYTDTRCASCQTIEAYTREAVAAGFAAGYKGWPVEFKGVNVDESANAHFLQDYSLTSKSVVVQKFSGGKKLNWARLDKVWQLLDDKGAFLAYVTDGIRLVLDSE